MTTLAMQTAAVRAEAARITLPSLSVILVTLIALLPFVLGWTANAVKQLIVLLIASARHGWHTGQRQLGPKGGGS